MFYTYVGNPNKQEILAEARELSLAYFYWLQTECPRDEGGFGYPELRLLSEATGTQDGLAQAPYVREGRRLKGLYTVTENDISKAAQPNARAKFFEDSVGLGGYAIDIHRCAGELGGKSIWQEARNYQIPYRSLVCESITNFAVASKAISISHIANGAYRLHPSEWAIGEAAGSLASFCCVHSVSAQLDQRQIFALQKDLVQNGVPIYWYDDMPNNGVGFVASQLLAISGVWMGAAEHLRFNPYHRLDRDTDKFTKIFQQLESTGFPIKEFSETLLTSHGVCQFDLADALLQWLEQHQWDWLSLKPSEFSC